MSCNNARTCITSDQRWAQPRLGWGVATISMTTIRFTRTPHPIMMAMAILAMSVILTTTSCTKPTATTIDPADPCHPTITAAASALDKRDNAAFLATLSTPLRSSLTQYLDLTGTGAAKLAKVLRDAKVVAEYDQVRIYESSLDGKIVTFMAVKEGEQWLLTGL